MIGLVLLTFKKNMYLECIRTKTQAQTARAKPAKESYPVNPKQRSR